VFYGSNPYRKDNPRWVISNATATPKVPDSALRLLPTVSGPGDQPVAGLGGSVVAGVVRSVCDACGYRRLLAHRPAPPRWGKAVRGDRRRGPLVALAGRRAVGRARAPVPGTRGSTCSGTTPRSSAKNCGQSWPAKTPRRRTTRAPESSDARRPPARAERPQPDVQPGNSGQEGAPPRPGRADLELALGTWHPRRPRRACRAHHGGLRPLWTYRRRGGRAGG